MSIEVIKVPDLGGADGVEVIEICVAVGDKVEQEDSLIVLESDKASMEVPSPQSGTVSAIKITVGDSLSVGDVILELEAEGGSASETAEASEEKTATEAESNNTEDKDTESESNASAEADSVEAKDSEEDSVGESASESDTSEESGSETTVEQIKIPDIGGAENVDVIEVSVAAGDEIAEGDSLIVLETDKASMEVPSPKAGKVVSIDISEGDTVSEGSPILQLEVAAGGKKANAVSDKKAAAEKQSSDQSSDEESVKKDTAKQESTKQEDPSEESPKEDGAKEKSANKEQVTAEQNSEIPTPRFAGSADKKSESAENKPAKSKVYAGPAVRRLAREMGVQIEQVKGSGPRSRITKDDLKSHIKSALQAKAEAPAGAGIAPIPAVDFSQFGEISVERLSKIHKVTAENMQRSWLNVPHVTQFDDADISELEDFRNSLKAEAEKRGVKITPLPFLLKACAKALIDNPKVNASLHSDGESMVFKHYVHIGMAVDTPVGLMVPVIRDVDKKSIWELAAETAELAQKAKDRKLKPAEMQGGCFTISSLGGIGGQGFTPIVNAPEVAILGVSRLSIKPQWNGSEFEPRKMLPLSLSYDHRAINGADAGRFLTYLGEVLADIRKLVM